MMAMKWAVLIIMIMILIAIVNTKVNIYDIAKIDYWFTLHNAYIGKWIVATWVRYSLNISKLFRSLDTYTLSFTINIEVIVLRKNIITN